MKEFDLNGLRLAKYQADLFEASINEPYSSAIFLRRFANSSLAKKLDKHNFIFIYPFVKDGIDEINEQFGNINYGKEKYKKEAMFWLGYLYQYISYTRDIELKFLMALFKPNTLIKLYEVYHTQDNEWVIQNILEKHNLTENIFDKNWRLKQAIINKDYFSSLLK